MSNRGIYIPEWEQLEKIAAVEAGRQGKPMTTGSLLRRMLQAAIRAWAKKNPSVPLD